MRNILICVDSVFQFLIASNLRISVYKNDNVDLIIYNSYTSARNLYEKTKAKDFFRNVYLADTPLTYCGRSYSLKEKIPKYFIYLKSLATPKEVLKDIIYSEIDEKYDHFIFNGDGALPECIFNACLKNNNKLKCYRIEDGYFSYMKEFGKEKSVFRLKFENIMHSIFGTKNIRAFIAGYYLSEPELAQIEYPYPKIEIPKFSRDDQALVSFFNDAFGYDVTQNVQFKNKTIYFEDGASFFDGGEEELEIMKKIIKLIPRSDILVKRHPRRKEDRFASMGIACCTVNGVPWEVIQMNCSFDGQCLISSCSGAIFNSEIYFGDKCKRILIYKLMKNPPFVTKNPYFEGFLNSFLNKFGKTSIFCPSTFEELNILK